MDLDGDFDPHQIFPICDELPATSYGEYCDRMIAKYGLYGREGPPKNENETEIRRENTSETETLATNTFVDGGGGSLVANSKNTKQTNANLQRKRGNKRKFDERESAPSTSTSNAKRGRNAQKKDVKNNLVIVKRDIPDNQRQKLPARMSYKIFGDRRSNLTIKQHEIHVACSLNFQRTGSLSSAGMKEHKGRKKALEEENRIFNEVLKARALKEKRKYCFASKAMKGFFYECMVMKKSGYNRCTGTYEKFGDINVDVTLPIRELPELEFKKLLTETVTIPNKPGRIVLPKLEQLCRLPLANPVDRKMCSITDDKTLSSFVEKFAPSFIMTCSGAKTLFTLFGPLDSPDWILPVVVENQFVQGQKRKLVYVLKPLPPRTLNNMQIVWYEMKHALKQLLLKKTHKDSTLQYSHWQLKGHGIIIRTNVDGEYNDKKGRKDVHASFLPKVDYQWEYGGETLRKEEFLHHWWTAFLKRSLVHLRFRISPGNGHPFVLAVEELQTESYFKLHNLNADLQKAIGGGMHCAWQICERLMGLEEGSYVLVRSEETNKNTIGIYRNSAKDGKVDIDVAKLYDGDWLVERNDILERSSLWMPIDPEVILQWHRIMKRAPATFQPRGDNEVAKMNDDTKKKKRNKGPKKIGSKTLTSLGPQTSSQNETEFASDEPGEEEFA